MKDCSEIWPGNFSRTTMVKTISDRSEELFSSLLQVLMTLWRQSEIPRL